MNYREIQTTNDRVTCLQICLRNLGLYDKKIDGDAGYYTNKGVDELTDRLLGKVRDHAQKGIKMPGNRLIIGIRNDDNFTDLFDDYQVRLDAPYDKARILLVPATTDAGNYYVQQKLCEFLGIKGTFAMLEGYYPSLWAFRQEYWWLERLPWFSQINNCKGYRDADKDLILDRDVQVQEVTPAAGILNHTMGAGNVIYDYSAGCQGSPSKFFKWIMSGFKHMEKVDYMLTNRKELGL